MKLTRPLLLPFVPLYWLAITVRNWAFGAKILATKKYLKPVIVLGNLSTGGTGKTPHTEYLVNLLKNKYKMAVLSRGYGRKTKGFLWVEKVTPASQVGDEPAQIKQKFNDVLVAVCENRVAGLDTIFAATSPPDVVVLDDAYQHRYVRGKITILLTAYQQLFTEDYLLPAGNLREPKSGAHRADLVVVTKCPADMSLAKRHKIASELNLQNHQKLFFSYLRYADIFGETTFNKNEKFLVVTGIANDAAMLDYLHKNTGNFEHLGYSDHHNFTAADLKNIIGTAKKIRASQLVTTSKDYQRLPLQVFKEAGIQVFVLPITIGFVGGSQDFDQTILDMVIS